MKSPIAVLLATLLTASMAPRARAADSPAKRLADKAGLPTPPEMPAVPKVSGEVVFPPPNGPDEVKQQLTPDELQAILKWAAYAWKKGGAGEESWDTGTHFLSVDGELRADGFHLNKIMLAGTPEDHNHYVFTLTPQGKVNPYVEHRWLSGGFFEWKYNEERYRFIATETKHYLPKEIDYWVKQVPPNN